MSTVVIGESVGRKGRNLPTDVARIGAALTEIGPERGGVHAPPLSLEGLAQAIEGFQKFQKLKMRDGRVDKNGSSLRRMNEVLNGGAGPAPPTPTAAGTGAIRPMRNSEGLARSIDPRVWTPVYTSLTSEWLFQWSSLLGAGSIWYFELDENVVPKWFGVLVPANLSSFDKAHLFFHPTPSQSPAGYQESAYQTLGNWSGIFHYLTEGLGAGFCAAGTGRILVMPLMTQGAAGTCGMFPQRWEAIVGQIFGMLRSGDMSGSAAPVAISSVVVSSFSSGITYSHHFRSRAGLGARLSGVIDLDGTYSTYRQLSAALTSPAGRVVRMQQMPASPQALRTLAAQNIFPLPRPRWDGPGGPWKNYIPADERKAGGVIHGMIPRTMMAVAASLVG